MHNIRDFTIKIFQSCIMLHVFLCKIILICIANTDLCCDWNEKKKTFKKIG